MSVPDKPPRTFDVESYREFERKMILFEEGPTTTRFEQLMTRGVALPDPESISDDDIEALLWNVIRELAELRAYLECTDHLSDRELYRKLWTDILRHEVPAIDEIGFSQCIDLSMAGDDDNTQAFLRHYADEDTRQRWLKDFPDIAMPVHVDPPFDRDQHLPRAFAEHDRSGTA